MAFTRKNDEAVSPVIGVILMVAITVILAAVIAAFVFGMSGNITKTKIVAVTVQQPEATKITVSYQGGQDAQTFSYGNVTINMGTGSSGVITWSNGTALGPTAQYVLGGSVGSTVTATTAGTFAGRDQVMVVGYFTDGTQQVLSDTYI
jgi:archaeal type IV pilus assembly protein PilA